MCGCGTTTWCDGGCECGCDHGTPDGMRRQGEHFALRYRSIMSAKHRSVVGWEEAKQAEAYEQGRRDERKRALRDLPIEALLIPRRAVTRLHWAGIFDIGSLVDRCAADLLDIPGLGFGSLTAIEGSLSALGLSLAPYVPPGRVLGGSDD